ncbi:AraC family transcriptional regulator [Pseudomonas sp. FW305-3-2-15-A-LB2]|nr:AraC family transcriptional regulator [Pseudomonas sp. FW305-3-2-15-C-TSA2]PMV29495.1 AraC family transcriptional regulator [Pseudomonas sp. DP16D-L5]PMV39398.1 AraC family transcriptional regulator [Pseudomonas sp. FW305-3-2-15-A-LB2]PMV45708.1 AraC family transcriptional regulator [Pseudomonas sp. FW305-3-2-15-C-R2A1]PMV52065.1 AraC family transcriptional regulator [Pseudomonas sp. FW305-3-2-15-C-LB1]PMV57213.1 AraC family transcriptional regulator [Pseudomonas sp. GW460-4]PMV63501.1 Ara
MQRNPATAHPPCVPPRVACEQSNDPFLQSRILPDWAQDYTQLSCGNFEGGVARASLGRVQVFREWINQAIDQRSVADTDVVMIGVTLHQGTCSWQNREMQADSLFIMRQGEEARFCATTKSDILAATIDASFLNTFSQGLYGVSADRLVNGACLLKGDTKGIARYKSLLLTALSSAVARPDSLDSDPTRLQLCEDVTVAALEAMGSLSITSSSSPRDHRVHRAMVDRARSFVLSNPTANHSVEALCEHLNMSRRGLHSAFIQVVGVNPCTYIRQVRLHGARKDILSGVPSVSEAAMRWGFWHFGMFSQYYKNQFGELPSETHRNPPCVEMGTWPPLS